MALKEEEGQTNLGAIEEDEIAQEEGGDGIFSKSFAHSNTPVKQEEIDSTASWSVVDTGSEKLSTHRGPRNADDANSTEWSVIETRCATIGYELAQSVSSGGQVGYKFVQTRDVALSITEAFRGLYKEFLAKCDSGECFFEQLFECLAKPFVQSLNGADGTT